VATVKSWEQGLACFEKATIIITCVFLRNSNNANVLFYLVQPVKIFMSFRFKKCKVKNHAIWFRYNSALKAFSGFAQKWRLTGFERVHNVRQQNRWPSILPQTKHNLFSKEVLLPLLQWICKVKLKGLLCQKIPLGAFIFQNTRFANNVSLWYGVNVAEKKIKCSSLKHA